MDKKTRARVKRALRDAINGKPAKAKALIKDITAYEKQKKVFVKKLVDELWPHIKKLPGNFTGKVKVVVERGKLKRAEVVHKYPKAQMMRIYEEYRPFYESTWNEHFSKYKKTYGAAKHAIAETAKEIERVERVIVSQDNLKQAMARKIDRTPMKSKTDTQI